MTGEDLDCPDYSAFMETTLKPLLQEYEPNDMYIAEETSFFYKMLANYTYTFPRRKSVWVKASQLQRQTHPDAVHQHDWYSQAASNDNWQSYQATCIKKENGYSFSS